MLFIIQKYLLALLRIVEINEENFRRTRFTMFYPNLLMCFFDLYTQRNIRPRSVIADCELWTFLALQTKIAATERTGHLATGKVMNDSFKPLTFFTLDQH